MHRAIKPRVRKFRFLQLYRLPFGWLLAERLPAGSEATVHAFQTTNAAIEANASPYTSRSGDRLEFAASKRLEIPRSGWQQPSASIRYYTKSRSNRPNSGARRPREFKMWPERESNSRHEDFQSSALPTELSGQQEKISVRRKPTANQRVKQKKAFGVRKFTGFLVFNI